MRQTDILIIGGGLAGLAATLRLAEAGHETLCINAGPAPDAADAPQEQRTTAVLLPGIETLQKAGAWEAIEPSAQIMRGIRMADCGADGVPRSEALFDAREGGEEIFGYNLQNGPACAAMAREIGGGDNAELLSNVALDSFVLREDGVRARLSDGTQIKAGLIIGADGRNSAVRSGAGIDVRHWKYGQKAIACHIKTDTDHENLSLEMHREGGPLTFAPLPGGKMAGLVWMNADAEANRLKALSDIEFLEALNEASHGRYGQIESVGVRQSWPCSTQVATALTAKRTALIAEAAHAFPPIGAQGYNLSLRDIETLAECVSAASDPGDAAVLSKYARSRTADIAARVVGVDALNRAVRTSFGPLREARRLSVTMIDRVPPLKRLTMRLGMGG